MKRFSITVLVISCLILCACGSSSGKASDSVDDPVIASSRESSEKLRQSIENAQQYITLDESSVEDSGNKNASVSTEYSDDEGENTEDIEEQTQDKPGQETNIDKSEESAEERQQNNKDFINKYSQDFVVGASLTLDDYIDNYKMSLAPDLWTIVKFDDTDTLIGSVDITYKDVKGKYFFVGTLNFNGDKVESVTPHCLIVNNEILADDGYCDDIFSKIANLSNL